jgi:hypothetical protein
VFFLNKTTSYFRSVEFFVFGKFNNERYDDALSFHTDHGMECYDEIPFFFFVFLPVAFFPHRILNQPTLGLDEDKIREGKNEKADSIIIMYHHLFVCPAEATK